MGADGTPRQSRVRRQHGAARLRQVRRGLRRQRHADRGSETLRGQLREALSCDGPVIIECVVDEHEPPYPARVKRDQVTKLTQALRQGTPNCNRIALQMVRDMLDESSFEASPAHAVPGPVGKAAAKIAGKLRNRE